jgi:predicted aldo/keto reductase-like oxidoreductase
MLYRKLAGEDVSQLGFGAMRLPTIDRAIDVKGTIEMLRFAIDSGVNYLDTAYVYHDGESEGVVGKALQDGYRDRTFVATKSPIWLVKKATDFDRLLNIQLRRLKTDRIDFYLLHALGAGSWEKCKSLAALEFLDRAKAAGKIRHAGFSFHDELPVFKKVVDEGSGLEFCQIQYNYLDREFQAGEEGLHYAKDHGLDVIVMEPLRGGSLARGVPPSVQKVWDGAPVRRSPAEWALRWIWDHPEVSLILSGMGEMAQVQENIQTAASAPAGGMTTQERELVAAAEKAYRGETRIDCTACGYCMPCPSGVDIPRNFDHYNSYHMFMQDPMVKADYSWIPKDERAAKCEECGNCEELCPQQLPIKKLLKEVAATFAGV